MISINSVYTAVQAILNKENRGYLRPEEFNNFAKVAFYNIYDGIKNSYSDTESSVVKGKANKSGLGYAREAMDLFYTPATLTLSSGQFSKPADFDFLDGMFYGDVEVTQVSVREKNLMQTISYMSPELSNPVYIEYNDKYEVIANDVIDEVDIYYFREPKSPRWTYITVGQDIVYDGANASKQDIELPIGYFNSFVEEVLTYAGLNIRDEALIKALISIDQVRGSNDYKERILTKQ